ncbi:U-box domain-containing protein 45-like isoform X1 [Benincasa hispida]|uniref:U-box domain-containing protein 45-like isoform X1 n=1 Tax=Benincasa hispida TaxID=102211 RepID=UPI0019017E68|nr:U-box domain-containing protein 45-like isoform X1 [Benincasa hispida]XP_038885191.1 U-box domain-containing protein 45-like isoform X1 [Benincasa hispida]XP_038885192.1 U-box domain-containing protein 45-like isoform X1 [Benincasa hispida]XP_038885193.1 U-box domain-containing protein 45-like isoform X1 [Benincasa hispida]
MDISEVEENLFAASDAKLHGGMCKTLSAIYCKVLSIFPSLEAARPRSKSGIQALCSLHVALEKAKSTLQHCTESSKLYLAITGDSVLSKFEKVKKALQDSLKRVEDIVPQSIGYQVQEIMKELASTQFFLDPLEKQVGDDIILLLQQGRTFNNTVDNNELEAFHQAAIRLGINSSRAALAERRALKKLIDRSRTEEDKRKESIVAYLLHLMRKYSKLFRSEVPDDNDSQGSGPCSPTVQSSLEDSGAGGNGQAFERQLTKIGSFTSKPKNRRLEQIPLPPDELRCPISLQLMYDPVIIASGQTYERICIEKWLSDGHNTCPKTQQKLSHLSLTPNYCVKGLIANWCEQYGVPVPDGPPDSLDLNYWRLALSEESLNVSPVDSVGSCKLKDVKVVPLDENCVTEEIKGNLVDDKSAEDQESNINMLARYEQYLKVLNEESDFKKKSEVVEQIRLLLKDDEEARIYMGANGFVQGLLRYLEIAVQEQNTKAQESGAMALFNLAVNNDRNKEIMLAERLISLLEEMIMNPNSHGYATALYLNVSCLEEAKSIIGSSCAVPFLTQLLHANTETLCKLDALHTLYNLSTVPSNIPNLVSSGIIKGLQSLLASRLDRTWTEKCIAILINLASSESGRDQMSSAPELIGGLAAILDNGEPIEQEQAVACLLILCSGNERCSEMVLQEGVIPGLVSMSVNGTARGKEKAQKLLMLFREQRQRESPPPTPTPTPTPIPTLIERSESSGTSMPVAESKPLCKSISRRKTGKALSFLWKSKSYSVYQC